MDLGRLARALAIGAWAPLAATACLLNADGFSSGSDVPAPGDSGSDGGGSDSGGSTSSSTSSSSGSTPSDAGGSSGGDSGGTSSSGGPNALINGDFELGCAGWSANAAFLSEATVVHNGAHSCKYCMDTNFEAQLHRSATIGGKKGETYTGEIWYQAASSVSALTTAGYVGSSLQLSTLADLPAPTPGPPLDGTWQRTTTLITLDHGDSASVNLTLRLTQSGNPASVGNVICVYVDDAAVRLLK